MKKWIALLLAMTMLMGVSAAFASAPSPDSVNGVNVIGNGDVEIVWTNDPNPGDDGQTPVDDIYTAQRNGSALDVLPKEIRDQLPEGYTQVNEIGSMKLEGDLDSLDQLPELKAAIKFDTPYDEGEIVYLAIGIPGEEETEWVLLEGLGNADRDVEVTFDHDTLVKIGAKTFAVMAISMAK